MDVLEIDVMCVAERPAKVRLEVHSNYLRGISLEETSIDGKANALCIVLSEARTSQPRGCGRIGIVAHHTRW